MSRASYVVWSVAAAGAYAALHLFANRFIYYPAKFPEGLWNLKAALGATDVWLTASDGVRVHAWSIRPPDARVVTLFLHGNAGNLTHRHPHYREIAAAGSAILAIDYRGYGRSGGNPAEQGLYLDADAAYDYLLKAGYLPAQMVVHGESLGTAVAVDLGSRRPCAGLILEAPFPSAKEVAQTVFPVIGPALVWGFDSRRKIPRVHAPLLIIQGDQDEVIPLRLGQALFAAGHEPKSFWIVPGAGHNDIVESAGSAYRERLISFYRTLAKPA